jgi:hypothetical protein
MCAPPEVGPGREEVLGVAEEDEQKKKKKIKIGKFTKKTLP